MSLELFTASAHSPRVTVTEAVVRDDQITNMAQATLGPKRKFIF
jgi:hypothetical protein